MAVESSRELVARELAREGLTYYAVIFAVTLTLAIMITVADVSIRNITAQCVLLFFIGCGVRREADGGVGSSCV